MLKITLTISDEQGIISNIEKSFDSSSVMHNFEEIETCCEVFVKSVLPQAEAELVAYGQAHFVPPSGKKKRHLCSKHHRDIW